MTPLRIATRQSRLALWQAEHVAAALRAAHPDVVVELVPMTTRGDRELDRSLLEIGGKGLFLKELEQALLDGRADLAVHSLKDVPARMEAGLTLAAYLPRETPDDAWICPGGHAPADLPPGAVVGTSSLRRQGQLLAWRPDLHVRPLRGNVETRLQRLDQGCYDAIILACAGLARLGLAQRITHPLVPPRWLPAPGQGVICVQIRADDAAVACRVAPLNCAVTTARVAAERALVTALGGDCRMPLAALAETGAGQVKLHARLIAPDGTRHAEARTSAALEAGDDAGRKAAARLLETGGAAILQALEGLDRA